MAAPNSANGHLSTLDFSTLLVEERQQPAHDRSPRPS